MDLLHCVSEKNAPTLASCSFDNYGLLLTIFGQRNRHTFRNDMLVQLSLCLRFYLLYFLLTNCDGNDA